MIAPSRVAPTLVIPAQAGIQYAAAFRFYRRRLGVLDRPPTRAMKAIVAGAASRSRDMNCPSLALSFRPLVEQRAQGKPGADRTHGPRAR